MYYFSLHTPHLAHRLHSIFFYGLLEKSCHKSTIHTHVRVAQRQPTPGEGKLMRHATMLETSQEAANDGGTTLSPSNAQEQFINDLTSEIREKISGFITDLGLCVRITHIKSVKIGNGPAHRGYFKVVVGLPEKLRNATSKRRFAAACPKIEERIRARITPIGKLHKQDQVTDDIHISRAFDVVID